MMNTPFDMNAYITSRNPFRITFNELTLGEDGCMIIMSIPVINNKEEIKEKIKILQEELKKDHIAGLWGLNQSEYNGIYSFTLYFQVTSNGGENILMEPEVFYNAMEIIKVSFSIRDPIISELSLDKKKITTFTFHHVHEQVGVMINYKNKKYIFAIQNKENIHFDNYGVNLYTLLIYSLIHLPELIETEIESDSLGLIRKMTQQDFKIMPSKLEGNFYYRYISLQDDIVMVHLPTQLFNNFLRLRFAQTQLQNTMIHKQDLCLNKVSKNQNIEFIRLNEKELEFLIHVDWEWTDTTPQLVECIHYELCILFGCEPFLLFDKKKGLLICQLSCAIFSLLPFAHLMAAFEVLCRYLNIKIPNISLKNKFSPFFIREILGNPSKVYFIYKKNDLQYDFILNFPHLNIYIFVDSINLILEKVEEFIMQGDLEKESLISINSYLSLTYLPPKIPEPEAIKLFQDHLAFVKKRQEFFDHIKLMYGSAVLMETSCAPLK